MEAALQPEHADEGIAQRRAAVEVQEKWREAQQEERRAEHERGARLPARRGQPRRLPPAPREHVIVEQREAQHEGQQIEEAVVAGRPDAEHERRGGRGRQAAHAPGTCVAEGHAQLAGQRGEGRDALRGERQLVHPPARPEGQRLRLVVVVQRGQVPPGGVAARELRHARAPHQAEEQPAEEPHGEARRLAQPRAASRPERVRRREQQRQEAGLEHQPVPLVAEEELPRATEREIQREAAEGGEPGQHADGEQHARRRPAPGEPQQRGVAAALAPAERRHVGEADVGPRGQRLEPGLIRQDAPLADQPAQLNRQRDERERVGRAEPRQQRAPNAAQARGVLRAGRGASGGRGRLRRAHARARGPRAPPRSRPPRGAPSPRAPRRSRCPGAAAAPRSRSAPRPGASDGSRS